MLSKSRSGQSVQEYGIILGLVAVVAIATLSTMGTQVSGIFNNMISTNAPRESLITSGLPNVQGTADLNLSAVNKNGQPVSLNIKNYPTSVEEAVNITGSDGTVEKMSGVLDELAETLKAEGVVDESEFRILKAMADRGFDISKAQVSISRDFSTATTNQEFESKGMTMKINVLSNTLNAPAHEDEHGNAGITALFEKFKDTNVAKQNPGVLALVEDAYRQIATSAKASADTVTFAINSIKSGKEGETFNNTYDETFKAHIKESVAGDTTLCDASKTGQVQGLSCVDKG